MLTGALKMADVKMADLKMTHQILANMAQPKLVIIY